MKFLRRLKTLFFQKPETTQAAVLPVEPPGEEDGHVFRAEKNLAWLPVDQEPAPLSLMPPACPAQGMAMEALLADYHAYVAQAEQAEPGSQTQEQRDWGSRLARDLQSTALDVGSSKAGEQSLDTYWRAQSAAIASLFADGPQSFEFPRYREWVHGFKDHRLVAEQVRAFDSYVAAHLVKAEADSVMYLRALSSARKPSEPSPAVADMDELLSYTSKLYPDGTAIKTYTIPANTHWPQYLDVVNDFYRSAGKDCWQDIEYHAHGAGRMIANQAWIAEATLADLQSMLTYCVRGEHFCDGHHGSMIEQGFVMTILKRLAVIRAEMRG
jgi:hypothetical protein